MKANSAMEVHQSAAHSRPVWYEAKAFFPEQLLRVPPIPARVHREYQLKRKTHSVA